LETAVEAGCGNLVVHWIAYLEKGSNPQMLDVADVVDDAADAVVVVAAVVVVVVVVVWHQGGNGVDEVWEPVTDHVQMSFDILHEIPTHQFPLMQSDHSIRYFVGIVGTLITASHVAVR
jgi:hypothetical protein